MIIRKCDRCKNEIKPKDNKKGFCDLVTELVLGTPKDKLVLQDNTTGLNMDLCQSCKESLNKWFEEVKTNE